jgi:hypothetical protein
MGKAYKAPEENRQPKFTASKHAVERFRERVEEEHLHRPDRDLALLLDARMQAGKRHNIRDNVDGGRPAVVYEFGNQMGTKTYFAVVRDRTVVTILDEAMGRDNFKANRWAVAFNAPFADKLLDVVPAAPGKNITPPTALRARQVGAAPPELTIVVNPEPPSLHQEIEMKVDSPFKIAEVAPSLFAVPKPKPKDGEASLAVAMGKASLALADALTAHQRACADLDDARGRVARAADDVFAARTKFEALVGSAWPNPSGAPVVVRSLRPAAVATPAAPRRPRDPRRKGDDAVLRALKVDALAKARAVTKEVNDRVLAERRAAVLDYLKKHPGADTARVMRAVGFNADQQTTFSKLSRGMRADGLVRVETGDDRQHCYYLTVAAGA